MRGAELFILIFALAVAGLLTLLGPTVWLVLLTDGLLVLALLAGAAGWGAWAVVALGLGRRSPGQQLCLATGLGLGWLGTLTLVLGVLGRLNRPTAWTVLAVGLLLGLVRLYRHGSAASRTTRSTAVRPPQAGALVLLPLAVPLVVMLYGASLPPGALWEEEARGYDVLEYHLQGPREYYQAGRIEFLPHNVYTSFPQQMEMLYLLLMHLAGGVYAAAIPAQLLHAACAILAVAALGSWSAAGWERRLVVLVAGSTPWLAYLGCLAYVENGMLFFAALAAGLVLDHYQTQPETDRRATLAAGLCAGLAGGCKYPALVFVGIGLAVAWLLTAAAPPRRRMGRLTLFGVGVVLAFAPWLVRNAAFTGNPVYPFAYEWFGGRAWSAEQAAQWSAGHRVPPEHAGPLGRLALAGRELFGGRDQRGGAFKPALFGPALLALAALGAVLGWSGAVRLLLVWAGAILAGWIGLTFVAGRFAVPIIGPLALLAGRAAETRRARAVPRVLVLALALLGALANDVVLWGKLRAEKYYWASRSGLPLSALLGQTELLLKAQPLNRLLPPDACVWLVGDAAVFYVDRPLHYTVVFSRDPWLEFAARRTPREAVDWLRRRGVTHVVFGWSEITRLRATYGFPPLVTPDWVNELVAAGLVRLAPQSQPSGPLAVEIYRVAPPGAG